MTRTDNRKVPEYYRFPGGLQVIDLTRNLTSNAGQAVGYIARSCRIDGIAKGNPAEDIRKSIDMLIDELDRLDGGSVEVPRRENHANPVDLSVKLIAWTTIDHEVIGERMELQEGATDDASLVEFAGRNCYDSHHRPNPATATTSAYIDRTVYEMGHGSIAEHASFTFEITGMSRAALAEITRHRHLGFSVRSQRFVDESEMNYVIPPAIRGDVDLEAILDANVVRQVDLYESITTRLLRSGLKRKQAREAARSILPSCMETRMVVTGNARAWIEFVNRRGQPDVDAEVQEIANAIRDRLKTASPALFSGI